MPRFLDGWDLINVTASEGKDLLADNGLVLGPKETIIAIARTRAHDARLSSGL